MENSKGMIGRWDVIVLPKYPGPVRGDGRATISNGLCYFTGTKGKKLEYAGGFLEFAGSEKGQRVQGLSGVAIPAYKGLKDTWISAFDQYDYKLDVQECVDMPPCGVQSANNASRPNWRTQIDDLLLKIYSSELSLDQGLEDMQKLMDGAKAP